MSDDQAATGVSDADAGPAPEGAGSGDAAAGSAPDPELLALRHKHPRFVGDWDQLRRLHQLMHERRWHTDLQATWNAWRATADAPRLDLRGMEAHKANLRELDLRGADLRGARLTEALLGRTLLAGADLRDAALRGADLPDTDLDGADLSGADLRWARRASTEQLAQARGDRRTVLPEGLTRPASWLRED